MTDVTCLPQGPCNVSSLLDSAAYFYRHANKQHALHCWRRALMVAGPISTVMARPSLIPPPVHLFHTR